MMKIWSELPGGRTKEQIADLLTLGWVLFWGNLAWQLFQFLNQFGAAGRTIRDGSQNMARGGAQLGEALQGLPLVGSQVRDMTRDAFAGAARPLSDFGSEIETFIFVVALVLSLMLVLVTFLPWMAKYLPWRLERLQRVRAAHRAIRKAPKVSDTHVERVLAMRAVTRLDYPTLLEYSPDPLGDWASGRHDRLARAELASVGLRP